MPDTTELRALVPEVGKDLRLNLERLLGDEALPVERRWGVAAAAAYAVGSQPLIELLRSQGAEHLTPARVDDARAAAALMGQNNVYYRFRISLGEDSPYARLPPRLRMNRLAAPATTAIELELYSLAVSAINHCELCVRSHEAALRQAEVMPEEIHAAVKLAAVIHGLAAVLRFEG